MVTKTRILISINIAAVMVLMDLSAINLALPSIRQHFQLSVFEVSLILMSSMLTATGFALVVGKLIETCKSGRILLISFLLFGLTSGLSSLCTHFYLLLSLRFIQGIAEAGLYVIGPALIKKHMDQHLQQKEYGRWMMSCGLGISIGPIIAAFLLQYFSWSAVFLINVPLAAMGIYFSWNLDREIVFKQQQHRFDYAGALFSFLFLAFFIITFNMLLSAFGTSSMWTWVSATISMVFLYSFIKREKRIDKALVDLQLFKMNNFRLANLGFYLFFLINVGSRFLRPFYFEEARGLMHHQSGLLMMISPLIMLVVSAFIHKIKPYFTTRQLHLTGNALLSLSMLMFSFWDVERSMPFIILSMVILGLAMGIYYPTTTQLGMSSLPEGSHGGGSAIMSISKSLGKLMGVLFFSLIFQILLQSFSSNFSSEILLKSRAIQYVFIAAFTVSLINLFISFFTNKTA